MSTQQAIQSRYLIGFGRRKGDRDAGNKSDNKLHFEKSIPSRPTSAGALPGGRIGTNIITDRDRLVYLASCFIGQRVDVQVKSGSIYTGILISANADKDFGVVLKMAQLIKDASSSAQKLVSDSIGKSPVRTFVIPASELVQVIAKDIPVSSEGLSSDLCDVKEKDILIDSYISQTRPGEMGRELERWVPDESDPKSSNLDNVFDSPWNRGWDQFEANEALFGVTSTFDEELYTTKLERGPQTKELEREALRIAREIEGEETRDLHLAEERGVLDKHFDIDEESKYSSVLREIDDHRYEDSSDLLVDSFNDDTFGGSMTSTSAAIDSLFSPYSSLAGEQPSQPGSSRDSKSTSRFGVETSFTYMGSDTRGQDDHMFEAQRSSKYSTGKQVVAKNAQTFRSEDPKVDLERHGSCFDKESPNATVPSSNAAKEQDKKDSSAESLDTPHSSKSQGDSQLPKPRGRTGLSPSSSGGSLSSEKSTLNPYAKEFKLNPNAKSFVPTQTLSRPLSTVGNGSFYYPNNVPHMAGVPMGVGVTPSYGGHQPVIYIPQGAPLQSPQGYFNPNGPQYRQHMAIGATRPVMYMPSYPPDLPYKRDY